MGLQKGRTNNPNGRPIGSVQRIPISVKETIIKRIEDDVDKYFDTLNTLTGKEYVRCMTELLKLIIPRPLNEEETDVMNSGSEMLRRLFGN